MSSAELTAAPTELPGVSPVLPARPVQASDVSSADLKRRTARGAVVSIGSQVGTFVLRIGSVMVLARLLLKEDFGLVYMVTAFTGLLGLIRDGGLSMAAVQRASITDTQTSALFWVNLCIGGLLALLAVVIAPLLAAFYAEPRLLWVSVVLGTTFIFNGAATQHRAMLQRAMRFNALAIIDILSVIAGMAAGIGMALAGYGYWSIVGMLIAQPAASLVGSWLATGWIPASPSRQAGIRSMLAYGGAITVTSLIVYLATNVDKVLLGRFWGAEALGIYGRAYQLINLPLENLNSTIGLVLFPALARVQHDPARLRRYFLKGYGLLLTVLVPITVACALFPDDIVRVFLGDKWDEAAVIFRLLAPGMVAFAFANPFSWLMLAGGHAGRSLRLAAVMTPLLILSYALGLPYGPQGVAAGLSITMTLAVVPLLQWASRGTLITMRDLFQVIAPLLVSIGIGAAAALAARPGLESIESTFLRLAAEFSVFFGAYLLSLLFVMKQRSVYREALEGVGLWPTSRSRARTDRADTAPRTIGLLDHMGYGNLGDAAVQEAVIANIRKRLRDVRLVGFSLVPDDTTTRHGIPCYPIRWWYPATAETGRDNARAASVDSPLKRALMRVPHLRACGKPVLDLLREARFWIRTYGRLRDLDLLIISGGGQLGDLWRGPWSHPYTLFKFAVLAKLARRPVYFLNVGAGPLEHPLSRFFARWAVQLADYRSFRDHDSRELVRSIGVTAETHVHPDPAYGLELPDDSGGRPRGASGPVVGLNPIGFCDPRVWARSDEPVYEAYLDKMTRFAEWLLQNGYALRVYSTETSVDRYAMNDLKARLLERGCAAASVSQIFQKPSATVADVLQEMAGFDFIVTAKFHGIVFSHLLGKPIVSLSYHRKMDAAMGSLGQGRFNADIERFDVEWLIGAFQSLVAESDAIRGRCRTAVQTRAADLSRQFDGLFTTSTAAIA